MEKLKNSAIHQHGNSAYDVHNLEHGQGQDPQNPENEHMQEQEYDR
jgi:hypothetical protein